MAGNLNNGGTMTSTSDILRSVKDINGGLNRNDENQRTGGFNPYDVNVHKERTGCSSGENESCHAPGAERQPAQLARWSAGPHKSRTAASLPTIGHGRWSGTSREYFEALR